MKKTFLSAALVMSLSLPFASAQAQESDPQKVGEAYIAALTGSGSDQGKDLLLGGVTMSAQLFTLENGKIVADPKHDYDHKESKDLKGAVAQMTALDKSGAAANDRLMGKGGNKVGKDEEVAMVELSKDEVNHILGATRSLASKFKKDYPVLAYVARADKDLYWSPKNPIRPILQKTGGKGEYTVEVHHYTVSSTEGSLKTERKWPLRVVRFTAPGVDTGWKVLPASDWNAE